MIYFGPKNDGYSYFVRRDEIEERNDSVYFLNEYQYGRLRYQPYDICNMWNMPFVKVFHDGNQLCALQGNNLQEGTAIFKEFDKTKDEFDQITDLAKDLQKQIKAPPGIYFWNMQEIEIMARQARK